MKLAEHLQRQDVQHFMQEHAQANPSKLALKYGGKVSFNLAFIAQQLSLRQKAIQKIPEFITPHTVLLPKLYEQCTSEAVARYKSTLIHGKTLLDATAGLGVDAFYIGRNFTSVTCLEASEEHAEVLENNFKALHFTAEIIQTQAESFLAETQRTFDVLYIDPDRRPDAGQRVSGLQQSVPDVIALLPLILSKAKECWLKVSPMADIQDCVTMLQNKVQHVYAIASEGEMKELLFQLTHAETDAVHLTAVNLVHGEPVAFHGRLRYQETTLSTNVKEYFFEPNTALIKSRLAFAYAGENGLSALYPNGMYFTSSVDPGSRFGRSFQVVKAMPYKEELIRGFLKEQEISKANIACRNFFDSPEKVSARFRVKDGGDWYLFCYCDALKNPMAVWCRKTL